MKLKKLLCILLCVMLVSVFAMACAPKEEDTYIDPYEELDDGDLEFDNRGKIKYQNVKLNMWSVTTGDDAITQDEIIAEFNNEYSGMIQINTTHISRYDLEALIDTTMQFEPENAPDIMFNHGSRSGEYLANGWLRPIEMVAKKANVLIDTEDYVQSLLDSVTIDGALYGLPQDVHSSMIVYRKDILEKNGLQVPTNYYELVEVCEQAIEKAKAGELWIRGENSAGFAATAWRKASSNTDYEPFPMAFGDMWVHEFAGYTAATQNGGEFVAANGRPAWNTTEVANGLQVLRDFVMPQEGVSTNKYAITKAYGSQYDVGNAPMLKGDCIFKLLGPWEYMGDLAKYDEKMAADGGSANIGTMSMSKMFAKDQSAAYASKIKGEGHAFMLMRTCESRTKQCAAMVFADWMVNNAGIKWAKRGHLPSLKSVENASEYRNDPAYNSYIKNWGSCNDYVVVKPTQYFTSVTEAFKEVVSQAMATQFRGSTIKSLLQQRCDNCNDYIDLYED